MTMFDSLERVLHAEAELAGLFSHSTVIGTAREFFVSRVLGSILPMAVSVGSGQVLHQDGTLSKQIDVIIHDDRFPVVRLAPGASLFLAEGVAAAVEVKSDLDKRELERSLQVSASLISEGVLRSGAHVEKRITEISDKQGISTEEARMKLAAMVAPKSFVYAFKSSISEDTFLDTVRDSLVALGRVGLIEPRLPRVIVAGEMLAVSHDEHLKIDLQTADPRYEELSRKGRPVRLVTLWKTDKIFGVLASVLLHMLMERLQPEHGVAKVGWSAERHLPLGLYFQRLQQLPSKHLIAHVKEGTSDVTTFTKLKFEPPSCDSS